MKGIWYTRRSFFPGSVSPFKMKSSEYSASNPSARWLALASICIAAFLIPQSLSAVNMALPAIADEMNADAVLISWIPAANIWGSVVLMLPAGRVADMLGRKKVYLIGVIGFALASLPVLFIETIEWLLVIRVLQGLFSALVFATGMAIVAEIFSDKNRGSALGLTSTSVYLGLTCGPLIGGWLTEYVGWRSVFWAPVPVALLAVALVMIYVKNDRRTAGAVKDRLDWIGSLLFVLWISAFFYGLSGLPELLNCVSLLIGVLLLVVFLKQQNRSPFPLVRLRLLAQNRVFNRSMAASVCMYAGHYPLLFLLSLYLQYIQGVSPGEAGQLVLIQALMMALFAPLAGRLSDHYEPRMIASIGCLLFSAGFAWLFWIDMDTRIGYIIVGLLALGVGFGLFSSPNNNAAMGAVPRERLSIAAALMNLSRTTGNMLGMAITVLLFNLSLGGTQIEPAQYPALLQVIKTALLIGCGYTLLAAYVSFFRGNVRS